MSISKGYDSTAVTALAVELGYRDVVTFTTDELGYDDCGRDNAVRLGLDVSVANQFDFHELPGHPEAEFCASNPSGAGMVTAGLGNRLEGRILLKGDYGDKIWSTSAVDDMPNFRQPNLRGLATSSMNEFRLRTGAFIFDVPAIGAIHSHKVHRISRSREMLPWSVGGEYDRPIPRRIAEEMGLPRESFGQKKMFGLHQAGSNLSLSPESLADFERYYESARVPSRFRKSHPVFNSDLLTRPVELLLSSLRKQPRTVWLYKLLAIPVMRLTSWRAHDWRRRSPHLYLFHWGFEKIKERYDVQAIGGG
jgi:hypothetical protein